MTKKLSCIVAHGLNYIIGQDGSMPWPRLKKDMRFFREKTKGHAVIMGRKTFESLPSPLKKRHNLVISRTLDSAVGCEIFSDPELCLQRAYELDSEPFVIGGKTIYKFFENRYTSIYQTLIESCFDGDCQYQPICVEEKDNWTSKIIKKETDSGYSLKFSVWMRK